MCPTTEKLDAFHDGELDEASRAGVERHLAECAECAAELARLREISRLFDASPVAHLSQMSLHRLHRRTDEAMEEGLLRIMRALSAVAACLLVAGSALLLKTRESTTVEVARPVAPPWADVVETSDTSSGAYSTPAAAWYLADDTSRNDDSP
jgi:anti-sigma factor RsiW